MPERGGCRVTPLYRVGKFTVGSFMVYGLPAEASRVPENVAAKRRRDPRRQPPVSLRPAVSRRGDRPPGALLGQGRLLPPARRQGRADRPRMMHGLGTIPVHREGGRAALHALDAAVPVLQLGRARRHLPGGHPLARRPPLPGPYRRGAARDGGAAYRSCRSASWARRRCSPIGHTIPRLEARKQRQCRGALRRADWTSPAAPTTCPRCGRSPTRS